MNRFPSRDDAAMDLIISECGHDHAFPAMETLEATGTETDASGHTVQVRRIACRRCGTVQVHRWRPPAPGTGAQYMMVLGTCEPPEPGDVPGLAERALRMTDQEYNAYLARRGFPNGVPAGHAPDRRATATPERLDLRLHIRAGLFGLLNRGHFLGEILPVPAYAESADLIEAVPGAALFWTPFHDGELPLTVVVSPSDPGPDHSYDRFAEISCRFHTGYVALREPAGRTLDLPPLPAGHADYRLRFHTTASTALLQIWNHPRSRPLIPSSA
ncbi:hypothetical protein [Spirillospora sp. NPDC029432]|uniref:hypothetical protein n=1 Tax=Spirillospora sp. NPDC029432 TaxID=3154599 RepID=UPI0034568090